MDYHQTINQTYLLKFDQIKRILIVLLSQDQLKSSTKISYSNENTESKSKIIVVLDDCQSANAHLQETIVAIEQEDDGLFSTFNKNEKSLIDVREELGSFVWNHSYQTILEAMPNESNQAKHEMIRECRAYCYNDISALKQIDEFQRHYRSEDAIKWYTKQMFLYRIVNQVLRTGDIFALYTFRYYILDLCKQLEKLSECKGDNEPSAISLYRGTNLRRNEVENLKVGSLIATNGFLSTTKDYEVAKCFSGLDPTSTPEIPYSRECQRQRIIFNINTQKSDQCGLVFADISGISTIPDEKETLFSLGSTFVIQAICFDDSLGVWQISMTSSSEVASIAKQYHDYIQSRLKSVKPVLFFGHLLTEVTGDYINALKYFHRLLRSPQINAIDRPNLYYQIARVYRHIGKSNHAITYFKWAQILQQRMLPDLKFEYGRTLAGLGTTYCELGDTKRAMKLYDRAMNIYRGFLPPHDLEIGFHLNRVAYAKWIDHDYDEALALLNKSIIHFQTFLPSNHPGYAEALHNMGLVQHSIGNDDESIAYLQKALRMRELLLGYQHPFVARTSFQLALIYNEKNDHHDITLEYVQKALEIRKKKLPKNHPELRQSMELLSLLSHDKQM